MAFTIRHGLKSLLEHSEDGKNGYWYENKQEGKTKREEKTEREKKYKSVDRRTHDIGEKHNTSLIVIWWNAIH